MEKVILCIVLLAFVSAHKHHPKFPPKSEETRLNPFQKVNCNSKMRDERDAIIAQSKCGEPKDVFEEIKPNSAHELVIPRSIWVKRCVGLCEHESGGSCVATKTVTKQIPVRIYNARINKDSCALYTVEEHVSCGCCALSADECASPRIFNPRKCSCQCPNMEERRNCLKKRNSNMRWNRSKCTCEEKRRIP